MEGKKSAKSFVDELFPRRDATAAKTDILSEIFPPKSAGSSRKQGSEGHNKNNARSSAADESICPEFVCFAADSCIQAPTE